MVQYTCMLPKDELQKKGVLMYDHKLSFFRLNKNINMWCCRSCELIELIDKIMTMDQNEKANIKGVIKRNIKFSYVLIHRQDFEIQSWHFMVSRICISSINQCMCMFSASTAPIRDVFTYLSVPLLVFIHNFCIRTVLS